MPLDIAYRFPPKRVFNEVENLVLHALKFQKMGACHKFQGEVDMFL